jgi:hypothetical protein
MTLENRLLEKLADWRPDTPGQALTVADGEGWSAVVVAEAIDTIGGPLRELRLARDTPLASTASLEDQAHAIADRVTGLLEPLRLVEVDQPRGVAQLRSEAPARQGDGRLYYEVLRHQTGDTSVARYQSPAGAARHSVPFTLTHEAIGKLVRDLTA